MGETGYNEFELRNFDPQTGRWVQVDPYDEFASGYVGMGNDPVNNVDPDGGTIYGGVNWLGLSDGANMLGNRIINAGVGAIAGALIGGIASGWDKDAMLQGAAIGGGVGLGATYVNWEKVISGVGNAGNWVGNKVGGIFRKGNLDEWFLSFDNGVAITHKDFINEGVLHTNSQYANANLSLYNIKDGAQNTKLAQVCRAGKVRKGTCAM